METMVRLLGEFDAELLQNLNSLHLEPAHFAFRWITLLLSREFLLPGNGELTTFSFDTIQFLKEIIFSLMLRIDWKTCLGNRMTK